MQGIMQGIMQGFLQESNLGARLEGKLGKVVLFTISIFFKSLNLTLNFNIAIKLH